MKTALITGASCGIGRQCAYKFAKEGFFTIINYYKSKSEAESLANEISDFGGNCLCICADVSDSVQAEKMFEQINQTAGGVDILVNNAGISCVKMLCDTTDSEYTRIFDVNMKGVYLCTKLAQKNMVSKKWGRIINISSVWGVYGASCESIYSASKSAVIGFTKAMSKELSPSGICVNAVAPGVIDTKMNAIFSPEEKQDIINSIPSGRFGRPEEIAELVYFLAGENASYITGQTISIDGGFGN